MNRTTRYLHNSRHSHSGDESPEERLLRKKVDELLRDVNAPKQRKGVFDNDNRSSFKLRPSVVQRAFEQPMVSSTPMVSKRPSNFFNTDASVNLSPIPQQVDSDDVILILDSDSGHLQIDKASRKSIEEPKVVVPKTSVNRRKSSVTQRKQMDIKSPQLEANKQSLRTNDDVEKPSQKTTSIVNQKSLTSNNVRKSLAEQNTKSYVSNARKLRFSVNNRSDGESPTSSVCSAPIPPLRNLRSRNQLNKGFSPRPVPQKRRNARIGIPQNNIVARSLCCSDKENKSASNSAFASPRKSSDVDQRKKRLDKLVETIADRKGNRSNKEIQTTLQRDFLIDEELANDAMDVQVIQKKANDISIPKVTDREVQTTIAKLDRREIAASIQSDSSNSHNSNLLHEFDSERLFRTLAEASLIPNFSDSDSISNGMLSNEMKPWRVDDDAVPQFNNRKSSIKLNFLKSTREIESRRLDSKVREQKVVSESDDDTEIRTSRKSRLLQYFNKSRKTARKIPSEGFSSHDIIPPTQEDSTREQNEESIELGSESSMLEVAVPPSEYIGLKNESPILELGPAPTEDIDLGNGSPISEVGPAPTEDIELGNESPILEVGPAPAEDVDSRNESPIPEMGSALTEDVDVENEHSRTLTNVVASTQKSPSPKRQACCIILNRLPENLVARNAIGNFSDLAVPLVDISDKKLPATETFKAPKPKKTSTKKKNGDVSTAKGIRNKNKAKTTVNEDIDDGSVNSSNTLRRSTRQRRTPKPVYNVTEKIVFNNINELTAWGVDKKTREEIRSAVLTNSDSKFYSFPLGTSSISLKNSTNQSRKPKSRRRKLPPIKNSPHQEGTPAKQQEMDSTANEISQSANQTILFKPTIPDEPMNDNHSATSTDNTGVFRAVPEKPSLTPTRNRTESDFVAPATDSKDSGMSSTLHSAQVENTKLTRIRGGGTVSNHKRTRKKSVVKISKQSVSSKEIEIAGGGESVNNEVGLSRCINADLKFKLTPDNLMLTDLWKMEHGTFGYLKLPPNGVKSLHVVKSHSLDYLVFNGTGRVQIDSKFHKIERFYRFYIPAGSMYSIFNDSPEDPLLLACLKISASR